jgi:hypothetical protein
MKANLTEATKCLDEENFSAFTCSALPLKDLQKIVQHVAEGRPATAADGAAADTNEGETAASGDVSGYSLGYILADNIRPSETAAPLTNHPSEVAPVPTVSFV